MEGMTKEQLARLAADVYATLRDREAQRAQDAHEAALMAYGLSLGPRDVVAMGAAQ